MEYHIISWTFSKFVLFFSSKGAEIDATSVELLFKKFIQSDTEPFLKGFLHIISLLCGSESLFKDDVGNKWLIEIDPHKGYNKMSFTER